ncbi:MAG TPA: hypothetical protein VFH58_01370, partial [Acidimicrobiales bacterium]|nr:hypothetical protein [Acidimicrobiales bacterium]
MSGEAPAGTDSWRQVNVPGAVVGTSAGAVVEVVGLDDRKPDPAEGAVVSVGVPTATVPGMSGDEVTGTTLTGTADTVTVLADRDGRARVSGADV